METYIHEMARPSQQNLLQNQ